jgi:hypothetical protein
MHAHLVFVTRYRKKYWTEKLWKYSGNLLAGSAGRMSNSNRHRLNSLRLVAPT